MADQSIAQRECKMCRVTKPADRFCDRRHYRSALCRDCENLKKREWRQSKSGRLLTGKTCMGCAVFKPFDDFPIYPHHGRMEPQPICKECYHKPCGILEAKPKEPVSDTLAAYFAGHFDGEGSVLMALTRRARAHLRVSLTGAHLPTLQLYRRYFGGGIAVHGKKENLPAHYRATSCWQLTNISDCFAFLSTISPYAVEKKEQIETALRWLRERGRFSKSARSDALYELAQQTRERLKELRRVSYTYTL